jgi:hypothetical protein
MRQWLDRLILYVAVGAWFLVGVIFAYVSIYIWLPQTLPGHPANTDLMPSATGLYALVATGLLFAAIICILVNPDQDGNDDDDYRRGSGPEPFDPGPSPGQGLPSDDLNHQGAQPSCAPTTWRGGRVVEGAALEKRYTGNGIVGSNPTLSAIAIIFIEW